MTIDPERFGRELAGLRDVRQITQASLAEKAGLTVNYISQIENGNKVPSIVAINLIAEALRLPAAFLPLLGSDPKGPFKDVLTETQNAIRRAVKLSR